MLLAPEVQRAQRKGRESTCADVGGLSVGSPIGVGRQDATDHSPGHSEPATVRGALAVRERKPPRPEPLFCPPEAAGVRWVSQLHTVSKW